jgi:ABC-type uncharacterized transport system involved in gliding motility auxiliary subunit
MSRNLIKQIGKLLGFVAVPLIIVLAIGFIAVRRFEWYLILGLIVLAVCIAVFAATNPEVWQRRLGRQRVSSSISGIVVIIALVGIIVLANVLLQRVNVQFDLTKNQTFTINDASVKVLERLNTPTTAYIFYSGNTATQQQNAADLLKQYTSRSDKLAVQTVNIDAEPVLAQKYNVKTDPSVIFASGTRQEEVTTIDEQSLTRGLLRLETGVTRRVLITTGHQEYSTEANQQGTSLSAAVTALTDNNYNVQIYNTATGTATPASASTTGAPPTATPVTLDPKNDILLIAGPRGKFSDDEKARITNFLKQGGKALIAYDIAGNQSADQATNVNDLLADWKVSFARGIIVEGDQDKRAQESATYLAPTIVTGSDVTSNLTGQNVFVLNSTAINKDAAITATFTQLLTTSENSYLKTTIPPTTAEFEDGKDVRGPLTVAATVELPASQAAPTITGTTTVTPSTTISGTAGAATATPAPTATPGTVAAAPLNTRIVLLGSPSVISDQVLSSQIGDYNFFFNAMNYLNETGSDIIITDRTPDSTPFAVNASQSSVAFWSSFLGLPVIILLIGLAAWWRRR